MNRITLAAAICGVVAVTLIVAGWRFVQLEPKATITKAEAATEANLATISPFELMTRHGRNLPVEHWRDAF